MTFYWNLPLHDFLYLKYMPLDFDTPFAGSYYMYRYVPIHSLHSILVVLVYPLFSIVNHYYNCLLWRWLITSTLYKLDRKFSRRPRYKNSRNLHLSRLYLTFTIVGSQRRGANLKIKSFSLVMIKVLKRRYSNILVVT